MAGSVSDIDIKKFTIGSLDLKAGKEAQMVGFNIYETILNPLGPYGEVRVLDATNAIGKYNINGKEDIDIQFTTPGVQGETVSFKFKLFQNKNVSDSSIDNKGSMHSKQYDFRFVSPEYLNAQGNKVCKSYNEQTSNMAKDIAQNFLKTKDSIDVKEQTQKERLVFNEEHPLSALRKLSNSYIGTKSQSNIFFLYKTRDNGKTKYVFDSPDNMFSSSPVVTLKQTATLSTGGVSETEKQNSIMWVKVGDGFNAGSRSLSKPKEVSYNLATGTINRPSEQKFTPKLADGKPTYSSPPPEANGVPVRTTYQSFNEKQKVDTAAARSNKQDYISHLAQNYADLEVPGNPKIKIGSIVQLELPKKADGGNASGETQFNGKALVVAIRHKVKPLGQTPRYTMILRVVKGSYKEGGGGNG
jgi:hypothetical protein